MRSAMIFLLSALTLPSVAMGQVEVSAPPLKGLGGRGQDLQRMSRYRDATRFFDRARIAYEQKDLAATRKHLDASLQLCPDLAPAHLLKSKLHYAARDFTKALNEVLLAKAGHESTIAFWERVQGERDAARKRSGREVIVMGVPASGYGNAAPRTSVSGIERQRDEELDQISLDVTSISRVAAEYSFFHGNVLLRMGLRDEAVEQYNAALRVRPDYPEAANNLVSVYLLTGRADQALGVIAKAEANGVTFSPELKKAVEDSVPHPPSGTSEAVAGPRPT